MSLSRLSYTLSKKGQLHFPGISYTSKKVTEDLLLKDAEVHHCFFRASGFHNHLSHHLLAVYDLGASAGHIQKIYEDEARAQRPIILESKDESIVVSKENWTQYLENQSAYGAFVKFFAGQVEELGVTGTLEKYIFDPEVNKNGVNMLSRVVAGALHPFIHIGYGAEFGDKALIATGLAEAAMTGALPDNLFPSAKTEEKVEPSQSITLLELFAQVYESKILHPPMPYDPNALLSARTRLALANGGAEEIQRLCSQYGLFGDFNEADIASKVEECIWLSTLLMTATGKEGRKPRLDFFLMHLVTSSLFLNPLFSVLKKPAHKSALLSAYIPVVVLITLARGRPRINPELLMSYTDVPRPPVSAGSFPEPSSASLGNPRTDADYNPWPAIIEAVQYHRDSHVPKALRTLIFASQKYGDKAPGAAIGAFHRDSGAETHNGTGKLDGTIFTRAAGLVMETLGWVSYGQNEGKWDGSALGWDAAWDSGD
ncbi:hypothetical protein BYT27DRAFT_7259180 [Phlegmacium glaucopus]|nr:hypothetical protein BYT27DRAFT_7259180 [Phlegmacium glaucopus]